MMTAVAYYTGLRPSEVVMLRVRPLAVPAQGVRLEVAEADISFDEPGEPKTGPRGVPIPPVLVVVLASSRREQPHGFGWSVVPNPQRHSSERVELESVGHKPRRVYDCRHAAATTWLRAGMSLAETVRRLRHRVEVLVSTYVGALDDEEPLPINASTPSSADHLASCRRADSSDCYSRLDVSATR